MNDRLIVRGAREHNLKNVSLDMPRNSLIVFTGLSGSGKSSLAFDTIFAEGQRRYVESLSAYARQFLGQMDKPDVDFIEGLSPAVSIDQKSTNRNPRSTVGTITEVYDYLRLLFARAGKPHCPTCGKAIAKQTPLAAFIAVTGVSGSGKSTLVNDILYSVLANKLNGARIVPGRHRTITGLDQLDKVVHVDQSPIGRTPRSNPATYTGVFDKVRALFSETSEAKVRGYQQGRFSFNVKGGRCENCSGDGTITIEMNFLPDVYVPCEVCHGARYNRETLEVHYKGKTIAQVLDMSIEEANNFFESVPAISRFLKTLCDVGLGYVRLGQSAPTLSGGEAQRVKLATELQRRSTGRTIYVLDEPTTGLHFEDVRKLLLVLNRLVDTGNTVIVIEHNLDVIKSADWVIDLGPEGGSGGGLVVAEGRPEEIVKNPKSYTGKYLAPVLKK